MPTAKNNRPKPKLVPGTFVYGGGTVFEVDNTGRKRARPELGPDYKGNFKHKYYKKPK